MPYAGAMSSCRVARSGFRSSRDGYGRTMSNSQDEPQVGIGDEQLPEDLQPGEDNPLADGLDDGETVDDLLEDGKPAEQDEDSDDSESETRPPEED